MLNKYIDDIKEKIIETTCELIKIDSVTDAPQHNAPFGMGCRMALDKALEIARGLGFSTIDYDGYMGACDIGDGELKLCVLCHLDVVPVGGGWSFEPFGAEIKNKKIYGRGAIDDKGPAVSAMYAIHSVAKLYPELKGKVRLLLGCDEENGSSDLDYYLSKENMPNMVFTPDGDFPIINVEKGRVHCKFKVKMPDNIEISCGSAVNILPGTADCQLDKFYFDKISEAVANHRLSNSFELYEDNDTVICVANGKQAHASTPQKGENALTLLLDLLSVAFPCSVFSSLSAIFPHGDSNGKGANVYLSDEIAGETSCVLSILKNCCAEVDIRYPCGEGKSISEGLSKRLAECGFEVIFTEYTEPHHVDGNSDFIKALLSAYTQQTGKKGECLAIGGSTYVHSLEGGVAFGAEHHGVEYNMHGADENISIEELILNTKIYAAAVKRVLSL